MMLRRTPELQAYGALADTVRMYLGNRVQATAQQKGSRILIRVSDIPIYGSGSGAMTMELPAGQIQATRDSVRFRNGIRGDAVRFLLDDGRAFPHAHIWDSGTPCWNDNSITNMQGLFCVLVNTITWMNISKDSRTHGGFTRCECTTRLLGSPDVWGEVEAQRIRISRKVGFDVRGRNPADFFPLTFANNLTIAMG